MSKHLPFFRMVFLILFFSFKLGAQQMMPLPPMTFLLSNHRQETGKWQAVTSPFTKDKEHHKLDYTAGAGILVNDNDAQHNSALISNLEHQDLDIEFEFMMPAGSSNSGIYLQGRYEVQLFDSWGKAVPDITDLGAFTAIGSQIPKRFMLKGSNDECRQTTRHLAKDVYIFQWSLVLMPMVKNKNARFNKVFDQQSVGSSQCRSAAAYRWPN